MTSDDSRSSQLRFLLRHVAILGPANGVCLIFLVKSPAQQYPPSRGWERGHPQVARCYPQVGSLPPAHGSDGKEEKQMKKSLKHTFGRSCRTCLCWSKMTLSTNAHHNIQIDTNLRFGDKLDESGHVLQEHSHATPLLCDGGGWQISDKQQCKTPDPFKDQMLHFHSKHFKKKTSIANCLICTQTCATTNLVAPMQDVHVLW